MGSPWQSLNRLADYGFLAVGVLTFFVAAARRVQRGHWNRKVLTISLLSLGFFALFRLSALWLRLP